MLQQHATLAAPAPRRPIPPGVAAFYYLWYGTPEVDGRWLHWDHEVLPHWRENVRAQYPEAHFVPPLDIHAPFYPARGPYSSRNATVVREHMSEMVDAGISVVVVSWWGRPDFPGTHDTQGVQTDALVAQVLDEAAAAGLGVAFHLEPYHGRSHLTVRDDVVYLIDKYGSHPGLLRSVGDQAPGLPVFYVYDSYHTQPAQWAQVLGDSGDLSVRGTDYDGVFIGLWLQRHHGQELADGGFDGAYSYFASDGFSWGSTTGNWRRMAEFAWRQGMLFVPSVGPGYDDRRIRPWNAHNFKAREGGRYYRRMFEAALQSGSGGLVSITSWNEFGEGTNIEAAVPRTVPEGAGIADDLRKPLKLSRTYSDYLPGPPTLYLDITREMSAKHHRRVAQRRDDAAAAASRARRSAGEL